MLDESKLIKRADGFDSNRSIECEEDFGHDWSDRSPGICEYCHLLHDCEAAWRFENDLQGNWSCEVCGKPVDDDLAREIETENAEARRLDQDWRESQLW